jgi:DNA-binding transcriptional regulator YdaS (Cro superfamily)
LPYIYFMNIHLNRASRIRAVHKARDLLGGTSALARITGVKPPTVCQWLNGHRPVPASKSSTIERETKGEVTRQDLHPDDWHLIWPELRTKGKPIEQPMRESKAA